MSEAKHTPGPWSIGTANGFNANNVYDSNDSSVAMVYGICMYTSKDEAEKSPMCAQGIANARLIAASPLLLEALIDMLKHGGKGDRDRAVLAIKKATGREP